MFKVLNIVAFIILAIGGLNWALIGIFDFNLVSAIFMGYRAVGSIIIYILVGLSAIWLVVSSIVNHGKISFTSSEVHG